MSINDYPTDQELEEIRLKIKGLDQSADFIENLLRKTFGFALSCHTSNPHLIK